MHFTEHKDPNIDRKVESELEFIRDILVRKLDSIDALILEGGFGRGEGSVLLENGNVTLCGDFDIRIILPKPVDYGKIHTYMSYIKSKVDIRTIDYKIVLRKDLANLPATMNNYDLKAGGYVFWGDQSVLQELPTIKSSNIPLEEGEKLLFGRSANMLTCFPVDIIMGNRVDFKAKDWFLLKFSVAKTILACCNVWLLIQGIHHHSYRQRLMLFEELYTGDKQTLNLVREATEFKLKPHLDPMQRPAELWFRAREFYTNVLQDLFMRLYSKEMANWDEYATRFSNKGGNYPWLKRLLRKLINRVLQRKGGAISLDSRTFQSFLLLLTFALKEDNNVDSQLLSAAAKIAGFPRPKPTLRTWEELRIYGMGHYLRTGKFPVII